MTVQQQQWRTFSTGQCTNVHTTFCRNRMAVKAREQCAERAGMHLLYLSLEMRGGVEAADSRLAAHHSALVKKVSILGLKTIVLTA